MTNQNQTTIRVWKPTDSENNLTTVESVLSNGGNVGHVSIETKEFYASFWPITTRIELTMKGQLVSRMAEPRMSNRLFGTKKGALVDKLESDEIAEALHSGMNPGTRRKADLEITLNGLNVSAMKALLEESKKDKKLWTMIGNSFVNLYAGHSCSSFAYLLLEAGGIRNLVSSYDMKYLFVKPEDIGEIAKKAKEVEEKNQIQVPIQSKL